MRAQGPGPARLLCLGSEHSASGSGAGRGSGQSRGRGGPRGGAAKTPSPAPQAQGQRALSPGRKRSLGSGGAHKVTRRTRAVAADTLARRLTHGKSSCKRLFHASGHMRVHTPRASRGVTRGGSVCPGPPRGSPRLPAPSKEWTLSDEPTTGVRVKRDSQGARVGCDSSGHPHTPSATAPRLGGRRRLMDRRAARSWSGGAYAPRSPLSAGHSTRGRRRTPGARREPPGACEASSAHSQRIASLEPDLRSPGSWVSWCWPWCGSVARGCPHAVQGAVPGEHPPGMTVPARHRAAAPSAPGQGRRASARSLRRGLKWVE